MIPLQCRNCQAPLAGDDAFCGTCGTPAGAAASSASPAGAAATSAAPITVTDLRQARSPEGFFSHPPAYPMRDPAAALSDPTRYLCAAAYLNTHFTNTVIGELVASHRAVVPSCDIDLVPIIRHCLSARKMQLTRDVMLSIFLLAGLVLATIPTIGLLLLAFVFSMLPRVSWTRRSMGGAFLAGVAIVVALGVIGALWFFFAILNAAGNGAIPHFGPVATGGAIALVMIVLLVLLAGTLVIFYYSVFRTLSERLGPGALVGGFASADPSAEARIAEVDAAQRGNVALYAVENPFIGAGRTGRVWSIATELKRARHAADPGRWLRPEHDEYVSIDPVELHQVIRDRLLRLNDPGLPENERISALTVHDHIVGEGQRRWESPLIDPVRRIPYSQASQQAIDALIRHPQAGLRYYQRASVTDAGQAVWADGREVIGRTDQEIIVSAFIYVAVEGRMFYLEFVPVTLAPIAQLYHIVDQLPKITSGQFMAKVLLHTARSAFGDVLKAPPRVVGTTLRIVAEHRSFRDEAAAAGDYVFGDVGARFSVRELGAALSAHTYIQQLDAAKYTRIIERLITDTVFEFLDDKGADTTAYRNSVFAVINSGVVISGGTVNAPVVAGPHSSAHMQGGAATVTPATG